MRAFVLSIRLAVVLAAVLLAGCGGARKPAIHAKPMPAGGSFTGVWFSPQYGEMHIRQNGSTALGRYTKDERTGRMQGSVEGDIMRFEWTEQRELISGRPVQTKGHGYFRLLKDDAEDTWKLVGEWGHDADETGGGPWNAVKSKTRKPELEGDGDKAPPSDSDGAGFEGQDVTEPSGSGDDSLGDL